MVQTQLGEARDEQERRSAPSEFLTEVLAKLDLRSDPISETEISSEIHRLRSKTSAEKSDHAEGNIAFMAELLAFSFSENASEDTGSGTYYGPRLIGRDAQGGPIGWPNIGCLTREIIEYWVQRANSARHPLMRIRYADLVWDLTRKLEHGRPSIVMAQVVIDSTIELAAKQLDKYEVNTIAKLNRALSVALSIGDNGRKSAVVEAMQSYEDTVAVDEKPGLWGFSFDALVGRKGVNLGAEQESKLISDLEARLERLSKLAASRGYPFGVEAAAVRLARYYRRNGRDSEGRRVLRIYKDSFLAAAQSMEPLVAGSWLQTAYARLLDFGLRTEADEVGLRIREVEVRATSRMKRFSASIEIPNERIEGYLQELTAGTPREGLRRITVHFVPDRDRTVQQVKQLARETPLVFRIPTVIQDHEGRAVARVGSVDQDLEGRVILQMVQNMGVQNYFLELAFERLLSQGTLSADYLIEEIFTSPVFDPTRRSLVSRGIQAYLAKDFHVALCVLVPEVEAALRQLLRLLERPVYRPSRAEGGFLFRTIEDTLRDEALVHVLTEKVTTYLRVVLSDQRGWNLRNDVCHGILPAGMYCSEAATRIVHVLLLLSLVRAQNSEDESNARGSAEPAH